MSDAVVSYILRKAVTDRVPSVKITENEYRALALALRSQKHAFALEERFDALVSGYVALERRLVGTESHHTIKASSSYLNLYELQSELNRRMIGFLNAARLYHKHLFSHVRRCASENATVAERLKAMLENERERHFEYRFIEALREYVANRGLPIHHVSHRTKSWQSDSEDIIEFSLDTFVRRDVLDATGGFSMALLGEMPDTVNLKVACRRYIESVNNVHGYARQSVVAKVAESRDLIDHAYSQYEEVYVGNPIGLCAMKLKGGTPQSGVALAREWDIVREELIAKNKKVFGLRRHLATGNQWIGSASPEARIARPDASPRNSPLIAGQVKDLLASIHCL